MKKVELQNGITLVALIITVIILLLLASISIGIIKNNGLIKYSQTAREEYNIGKEKEENVISKVETQIIENVPREVISKTDSFVGCYADIDVDGIVDGIIYADLAIGGSGQWSNVNTTYTIPKDEKLDNYYISQENYKEDGFKENIVISPIKKNKENKRFYIMALSNIEVGEYNSFYWYKNASGLTADKTETLGDFGTGKSNTQKMMTKYKNEELGIKDDEDVWNNIATQVQEGWFVPSRAEWGAFADLLEISKTNMPKGIYNKNFWTSSYSSSGCIYWIHFYYCTIGHNGPNHKAYIRLSTTF